MTIETFAHIVAHDLKAPLNGIASIVDFVVEDYADRLDEDGREQLRLLQSLASRGVAMIDALRLFSRVSDTPVHPRPLDLGQLAPRLLQDAAARAPAATIHSHVAAAFPPVLGDPALVPLMLRQLFDNAVRFSDHPTRNVWFEPVPMPAAHVPPSHAVFVVRDDGLGIAERFQDTVFDMFKRLHAADRFGGGVGAGLAVARLIIKRHGGCMWLTSVPEQGTSVFFSLPAGEAPEEP